MNSQLKQQLRFLAIQKKAIELRNENRKDYTKTELNIMARAAGIRYFYDLRKYELARELGIELV